MFFLHRDFDRIELAIVGLQRLKWRVFEFNALIDLKTAWALLGKCAGNFLGFVRWNYFSQDIKILKNHKKTDFQRILLQTGFFHNRSCVHLFFQ